MHQFNYMGRFINISPQKSRTENEQLMENPIYTRVEGCSPQATLVCEGTNSKICQKTY
jgi:hypothetical protein